MPPPAARLASDAPPHLGRLFEDHHGMVFRTAYRVTGSASDAEDVLQTVFLRLMKRTSESAAIDKPESYLRRAAVNAALDVVRARRDSDAVSVEDMPSSAACTELRELRDELRRALATLPPKLAEVFALRFFEGHSNQEIGKMLGMSQVFVAVTVHRARRQLQKWIEANRTEKG
ncbi:MAG: sigma-70 family RNA polymerase sigma factor [Bryobacteraceae bacterium]